MRVRRRAIERTVDRLIFAGPILVIVGEGLFATGRPCAKRSRAARTAFRINASVAMESARAVRTPGATARFAPIAPGAT